MAETAPVKEEKKAASNEPTHVVREVKNKKDPFLVYRSVVRLTGSVCDRCGYDARDAIKDELIDWDAPYDANSPDQDRVPEYEELRPDQKARCKKMVSMHKRACAKGNQKLTPAELEQRKTQFTRKRPI